MLTGRDRGQVRGNGRVVLDIAGLLAGQLLSEVFSDVRTKALPRLERIEGKLDRIADALEQQRVGDLTSGLEYLGRDRLDRAADLLLELDNHEPDGVLTKLAEGAVLERLGEREAAASHLAEALMRNPFVAPAAAQQLDLLLSVRPDRVVPEGEVSFELRLEADATSRAQAVLRNIQDLRSKYSLVTRIAAAYSPVDGTGHVAVAWCRTASPWRHADRIPAPRLVSIFDLATADLQWSRTTDEDLAAVTPRYVILRSPTRPYEFRLVKPGQRERVMSQSYFEAMFWPGWGQARDAAGADGRPEYLIYPWDKTYEAAAEDIGAVYHYLHHGAKPFLWRQPRPKPAQLVATPGPRHPATGSELATISVPFANARVSAWNRYSCTISGLNHDFVSRATLAAAPLVRPARELIRGVTILLTRQLLTGETDLAGAFIDRHLAEQQARAARNNGSNLDSLGLHLSGFLSRAREEAPEERRQAALGHALSWSRTYLDGRANVLGAAPYLGIRPELPGIDVAAPMTKSDLWGMWSLVCGLALAAGGDVAALVSRPNG